jgi:hypothetical protein
MVCDYSGSIVAIHEKFGILRHYKLTYKTGKLVSKVSRRKTQWREITRVRLTELEIQVENFAQ